MLNPAMDMAKPQGLSKHLAYTGVVVQNNDGKYHKDKRMLGRVQLRVSTIFDGIDDIHLPWAIPEFGSNCDGSSATSGSFSVPKIGTKVLVYFQDGSPLHPKYSAYTVDAKTALKEREHNYPDRTVHLFQNGCLMVVDTKSNEVFFRNPGTLQMYVVGDLNLSVDGNVVEKIDGNRTTHVKGNVVEKIDGNRTVFVQGVNEQVVEGNSSSFVNGSQVEAIEGARQLFVGQADTETISSSRQVFVTGDDMHSVSGHIVRSAARIDDNPGGGGSGGAAPSTPDAPIIAAMPVWHGIRGKKPDTTSTDAP